MKKRSKKVAFTWLISSIGLLVSGAITVFLIGPLGLALLTLGLILTMTGVLSGAPMLRWFGTERGGKIVAIAGEKKRETNRDDEK